MLLVVLLLANFFYACSGEKKEAGANEVLTENETPVQVVDEQDVSDGEIPPIFDWTGRNKEMVRVEGGSFIMGSVEIPELNPPHRVTLDDFYMAKYLVTAGEWKVFLADTGLSYKGDLRKPGLETYYGDLVFSDDCPAQGLNWYYAIAFCNWLSIQKGLKPAYTIQGTITRFGVGSYLLDTLDFPVITWDKQADGYRLPTEAEWEYAARGGQLSEGYLYAGSNDPYEVGKYEQNESYPVGQMRPNELELYDMTGCIRAWCWDWYDGDLSWLPEKNPSVDNASDVKKVAGEYNIYVKSNSKVTRNESWKNVPVNVYHRNFCPALSDPYSIGIRLARNGEAVQEAAEKEAVDDKVSMMRGSPLDEVLANTTWSAMYSDDAFLKFEQDLRWTCTYGYGYFVKGAYVIVDDSTVTLDLTDIEYSPGSDDNPNTKGIVKWMFDDVPEITLALQRDYVDFYNAAGRLYNEQYDIHFRPYIGSRVYRLDGVMAVKKGGRVMIEELTVTRKAPFDDAEEMTVDIAYRFTGMSKYGISSYLKENINIVLPGEFFEYNAVYDAEGGKVWYRIRLPDGEFYSPAWIKGASAKDITGGSVNNDVDWKTLNVLAEMGYIEEVER
jgi:formylglycine-generating enzyme required for sulfatase activity